MTELECLSRELDLTRTELDRTVIELARAWGENAVLRAQVARLEGADRELRVALNRRLAALQSERAA